MKIKFTKLPTNDGTIKVSLDGGQSFTEFKSAFESVFNVWKSSLNVIH